MVRLRALIATAAVAVMATGLIYGQGKDTPAKTKGSLPSGWSKLKLSAEQKQKVYNIRAEYKTKIDELSKQIAVLRDKELADCVNVLTSDQKEKLKKIVVGETPEEKKEEKKK